MGKKTDEKLDYARAYEELKNILDSMENSDADVDHVAGKVKRAAELLDFCQKRLRETEVEVRKIIDKMESHEDA